MVEFICIENVKESWNTHQEWLNACQEDESLGAEKKGHVARIKKRIEKIEEELTSLGVNIEDLKKGDADDTLLGELDSDKDEGNEQDVDELPDSDEEKHKKIQKEKAKKVAALPTMEEKKEIFQRNASIVTNNVSGQDPEVIMKARLGDYINAIEYLKKHNLSKDQKNILNILDKAEQIKKLQKRMKNGDDVEVYEIPGEITPEDLFGFNIKERIDKFQKYNNIIDKSMNELKTIGGNNVKIFNTTKNPTAKENYEKSIEQFKKQAELKKKFIALAKNKWQPLPEVQVVSEMFTDVHKSGEVDLSITGVNVKLDIPEDFSGNSKYSYKFKWMDGNNALKKKKIPNNGESQEASYKIDFGHHK